MHKEKEPPLKCVHINLEDAGERSFAQALVTEWIKHNLLTIGDTRGNGEKILKFCKQYDINPEVIIAFLGREVPALQEWYINKLATELRGVHKTPVGFGSANKPAS
jgi:hypothetical protein